jgi:tetratricopeptide (TPR) repeat protein
MSVSAAAPRVLRVFISSTFRDMQGEREELVKRVFPEIRHVCEERGVVWGEVDLRWGVTDEQKAEDAVLPICLAEIERTRPYFIGMLGDRYGWVPDEIPRELAEREGWLTEDGGRSVTEMEILHGVLRDPAMAGHAYFYLRDPAWTATLPEPERATYEESSAESRDRLADLKARVRASGFPVRDYPDPRGIGDLVRSDLLALVDRLYPPEETPDPIEQARLDQEAYAARLVAHTIERRNELIAVDVAVDGDGPGAVVSGVAGGGVSTLLAAYADDRARRHPEELVLRYFVDAQRGEATEHGLLAHVCRALGDADVTGDLRARTRTLLEQASASRRVVLVVDGLHLIERAGGGVAWLPSPAPANLRVVAGTRPGATLGWLVQRGLTRVDLPQFDAAQRTAATTTFLAGYAKALDRALLDRIGAATPCANPRHLRTVLDELRQHGDHFTLPQLLDGLLAPADLAGLVEVVLDRYERDYELDRPGLVGAVLGPLAAACTGLTDAELLDLLGDGARRPLSQLQLASGSVIPDIAGRLRLGFDEVAAAARRRYLTDAADVHRRVAGLFAADPRSPRALEELPWQLLAAGDDEGLRALLVDPPFIEAAYDTDPNLLARLWARLEETSAYRAATAYAPFAARPLDRATSIVTPLVAQFGGAQVVLELRAAAVDALRTDDPRGNLPAALANLAAAQSTVGQLGDALHTLDELERTLAGGGAVDVQIALYQNRGVVLRGLGRLDEALRDLERAETTARGAARPADVQAAAGERAGVLAQLGRTQEALAATGAQVEAATASGEAPARMRALLTRAPLLAQTGDIAGSAKCVAEGEFLARDLGDLEWLATALTLHVQLRQWENRLDLARDQLAELIAVRERLGQHDVAAQLRAFQAQIPAAVNQEDLARLRDLEQQALQLQGRGDHAGAIRVCTEMAEIARRSGNDRGLASALGNTAVSLYYLGRMDEAAPLLDEQIVLQRKIGDPVALATALANAGELHGRLGEAEAGLAMIGEAEQLARGAGQAQFADQIAALAEQIRRR